MEQHVSYIFIYYKGHFKKASQFFMALEPVYKKLGFNKQNVHCEHCHKVKNNKKSLK